jgi:hypothetical protein
LGISWITRRTRYFQCPVLSCLFNAYMNKSGWAAVVWTGAVRLKVHVHPLVFP